MDTFAAVIRALDTARVRFVVIGVWGANYYANSASVLFTTLDRDLFLPADPENLLNAWSVCDTCGLSLWAGHEPLDTPRDLQLAQAVVERRALTRGSDDHGLEIDLSLVMAGFEFADAERDHKIFVVDNVEIPVARLSHIVQSKAAAGREKDRLFLATHREALRDLLDEA